MANDKQVLLTAQGLLEAKEKLEYFKVVRRKEVTEKIRQAKAFGDLSENSEYDEAKNEEAEVAQTILELENMINNAVLIDESAVSSDEVSIGSKVEVKYMDSKKTDTLHIVGPSEVDLKNKKISYESPVGSALIGNKIGKTITVSAPKGDMKIKIVSIVKE